MADEFLRDDLPALSADALRTAGDMETRSVTGCVGFFDLVGSTALKLERGHVVGTQKAREFVALTSSLCESFGGVVMKSLGDGIMVAFGDPLAACRAALAIKRECVRLGIRSSGGLCLGVYDVVEDRSGKADAVGSVVDKAARLEGIALPGQILIDTALMEAVRSHLAGYQEVLVSDALEVNAKGLSTLSVHELSLTEQGLADAVVTPFEIYSEGRMTIAEKTRFARQARREIKEFGTGLTAFARFFTGHRPGEFKDHVHDLLARGVDLNCYGLSPTSQWVEYVIQTSGADYVADAARARKAIIGERNHFLAQGLPGELRYFEYDHVPEFHGFCVDADDPVNAQILISFYLPGMARAEAPVYQVARSGKQAALFEKYLTAIRAIEATASQVDE